jgi:glycosyltransferase involved in cell wall biosynthesis
MQTELTIITVTRNDLQGLKYTAQSVIPKLSSHVRWVIIDGLSSDGTMDYIESIRDHLYYFVSEKDEGIYNAMNKGALHSPVDSYLIWINSGDFLLSLPVIDGKYDAYFYGVKIKETGINKIPFISKNFGIRSISPCSQYFHQGFLVRRKTFLLFNYDENIGLSADMLLMLKVVKNFNHKVLPEIISIYSAEGQSNARPFSLLYSHLKVVNKLNLSIVKYIFINNVFIIKCIIKSLLPFSWLVSYRTFRSVKF